MSEVNLNGMDGFQLLQQDISVLKEIGLTFKFISVTNNKFLSTRLKLASITAAPVIIPEI